MKSFQDIHDIFQRVSPYYDRMNSIFSLGLHRFWKRRFAILSSVQKSRYILDMSTGTGDMIAYLRHVHGDSCSITACDPSDRMLDIAKKRYAQESNIQWIHAYGEDIPLSDKSIDLYTIAFGMRNMTDMRKALEEAQRVLKPGGCFSMLEFSPPSKVWLSVLYQGYQKLFPWLGQCIAGDGPSYRYLADSIQQFPSSFLFESMLKDVGFRRVCSYPFTNGLVIAYQGWKV